MASLYTRKGIYYVKYQINGEPIRTSLRTKNEEDALEALEDLKAALRYELIGLPAKKKKQHIPLLGELFDEYLVYIKKHREPRSYEDMELRIRGFLRPSFGHLRPDQLTDKHLEDFVGKLLNWTTTDKDGKEIPAPYHPETINKRLKCLGTVLKRAARPGPGNVIDKVPVSIAEHLLRVPKSLPKYITPDEFAKWLPCITKPLNRYRAVIELCTGIPDSELARLRWDKNYVKEWGQLKYRRAKTTTDIIVTLNEWAKETINRLWRLRQGPYMFHGIKEARRAYEVASKNSGVKVTPHMLRHSFATWALSDGESMQKIQQILGHASISTTQRYAKVIPQFLAQTTNAIDRMRPRSLRPRARKKAISGTKRAQSGKKKKARHA